MNTDNGSFQVNHIHALATRLQLKQDTISYISVRGTNSHGTLSEALFTTLLYSLSLIQEHFCSSTTSYEKLVPWYNLSIYTPYYEMTPKKKTISCAFINLMENIREYNTREI